MKIFKMTLSCLQLFTCFLVVVFCLVVVGKVRFEKARLAKPDGEGKTTLFATLAVLRDPKTLYYILYLVLSCIAISSSITSIFFKAAIQPYYGTDSVYSLQLLSQIFFRYETCM